MSDYPVGYKKPPKHTQFKKGHSGNPRGRPKGQLNLKTDLENELRQRIQLKQAGKPIQLTKQQALVKTLVARAIKGDPKASNSLLALILKVFEINPAETERNEVPSQSDEALIRAFLVEHGLDEEGSK